MKISIDTKDAPNEADRKMIEAWLAAYDFGVPPPPPSWGYELALLGVTDGVARYRTGDYRIVDGEVQPPLDVEEVAALSLRWQLPPDTPAPKVVTALLTAKPVG